MVFYILSIFYFYKYHKLNLQLNILYQKEKQNSFESWKYWKHIPKLIDHLSLEEVYCSAGVQHVVVVVKCFYYLQSVYSVSRDKVRVNGSIDIFRKTLI